MPGDIFRLAQASPGRTARDFAEKRPAWHPASAPPADFAAWGDFMARAVHYRCYFLDAAGSIHSSETIAAATEADAIGVALRRWEGRRQCRGIELWQGHRRLYVDVRSASPEREFTLHMAPHV